MPTLASITAGAPGLFFLPDTPIHRITGVRMDVCAFVGVAPRGPSREPAIDETWTADGPLTEPERPANRTTPRAVESFQEYRRLFGGFEGPGLLPYAVASFFENGGVRAYVARIVHDYTRELPGPAGIARNRAGAARGVLPGVQPLLGEVVLRARNEGAWGNGLRVQVSFRAAAIPFDPASSTGTRLALQAGDTVEAGTLFRARNAAGLFSFHFATFVDRAVVTLDAPLPAALDGLDVVTGALTADDGDGRSETHGDLAFHPLHTRWLATVLAHESELVFPDDSWSADPIRPVDALLGPGLPSAAFTGGEDRYRDIVPGDFFDLLWTPGDEAPGQGVHSLVQLSDLASVAVPDLYSPRPLGPAGEAADPVSLAGPEFRECFDLPRGVTALPPEQELEGLQLDPNADFDAIVALQGAVVELAETLRSWVALLDVPPGLSRNRILAWRNALTSSYAAAYHPWLVVSRADDAREGLVRIPPTGAAAGIIAQREIAFGVPHGPANVLAADALDVETPVSPERHDELHANGINVYLRERDGVRLTAARTLSRDRDYRQLSVRRLMVLLRRTLEQQTQWTVFEPNNLGLRVEIRQTLSMFLRQLFLAGAFRGATEADSFFVRCDESNNPGRLGDLGQLVVEVGVAPSEPLEFIVVRITRDSDGSLAVQEGR